MSLARVAPGLFRGTLAPLVGELGASWQRFGAEVIIGHPTFRNAENIRRQLADGIRGASRNFPGRRVAFVVSDGTWTRASQDRATVEAALAGAREALDGLPPSGRERLHVVATPYEGYGGDETPGKGSALKLIFDEMGQCAATMLVLLDGDLRNDMAQWQEVFARVEASHREEHADHPFFVTARYARHFVDASLTRFVVGPLTTLMGRYVPGGISGDIVLSAAAVARERQATWTPARRKYGTDIATTFDNVADPETEIYEIYLGAKLHDITDEAKLSVMPGEVIGAALERLLHWEHVDGRVTKGLASGSLTPLRVWGPDRTGIDFIDPGYTDVFNVDAKLDTLGQRFADFESAITTVQGEQVAARLRQRVGAVAAARADEAPLRFLDIGFARWVELLGRAVGYALARGDVEQPKRCLSYLYTAAFLEFVKDRLVELGHRNLGEVREAQAHLGVEAPQAQRFYQERVDGEADRLARLFFDRRKEILRHLERLSS